MILWSCSHCVSRVSSSLHHLSSNVVCRKLCTITFHLLGCWKTPKDCIGMPEKILLWRDFLLHLLLVFLDASNSCCVTLGLLPKWYHWSFERLLSVYILPSYNFHLNNKSSSMCLIRGSFSCYCARCSFFMHTYQGCSYLSVLLGNTWLVSGDLFDGSNTSGILDFLSHWKWSWDSRISSLFSTLRCTVILKYADKLFGNLLGNFWSFLFLLCGDWPFFFSQQS